MSRPSPPHDVAREEDVALPSDVEDELERRSREARALDDKGGLISGEEQIRRLRARPKSLRTG
jgi:hypothetical protein